MATANLSLPEITESQGSKYITHNNALAILDRAITNHATHNMASDADYTLAGDEMDSAVIIITDTGPNLTTGRNIIVSGKQLVFAAVNSTAQTITFETAAGTGIAVATVSTAILRCDGTNVHRVTADV